MFWKVKGSPPLARGILLKIRLILAVLGITPACAGNTGSVSRPMRHKGDHPRLRGEYILVVFKGINPRGSPPLARGIRDGTSEVRQERGITPACAGNTRGGDKAYKFKRDHPRLRGEYHRHCLPRLCCLGSPPLARGIPFEAAGAICGAGITPACAGNTNSSAH